MIFSLEEEAKETHTHMQVFNAIIIYILLPFNCVSGEKSKRMLNLLRSMCYPSVLDLNLGSVNVSLKYIGLLIIGEQPDVKQSLEILAYRPMTFLSQALGFEPGTYRNWRFFDSSSS